MSDFSITRPLEVTAANVTSNVPETPPAAYNPATSYSIDGTASVLSGTNNTTADVYRSLVNSNLGNAPASSPAQWLFLGTLYADWNSGTAYSVGARVSHAHSLWDAVQPGSAKEPGTTTGAAYWSRTSETEVLKMFGESPGIKTEWAKEIATSIDTIGIVNSVGLIEVNAASASVKMTEDGTVLYDETVSLIDNSIVSNWFDYFFEPIRYRTDYTFDDLPAGFDPTIDLTLTSGGTVSIGKVAIGQRRVIGQTVYPSTLGSTDFSNIEQDEFGSPPYITKRRAAKRNQYLIRVEEADIDWVYKFLADVQATALLISASPRFAAMTSYGLLGEWKEELSGPNSSLISAEVKGF